MLAALLAGFVVGAAFGAYLLFAVIPPTDVTGGATPHDLYHDPDGNYPQYRDYYAARASDRFAALGGAASEQALMAARDELGVTTGEVTPADALAMVRGALLVAAKENAAEPNPDAGRFTLRDQQNLSALADRLEATQGNELSAAAQSVEASRNLLRIGGLIGLVVLILSAAVLLWILTRALGPSEGTVVDATSEGVRTPSRTNNRPAGRPAVVPISDDRIVVPDSEDAPRVRSAAPAVTSDSPFAAGGAAAPAATSPRQVVSAGEQRIGSFDTVYEIGDDRYDDSFPIHGAMGELIGECGASIVERIDVGSPARVVAVAVWLFDKGDFQSTTKVLMSDFAFGDAALRDKLRNRGDALQARLGSFDIVTSALRVEVEVTMLECAPVGGASSGYFEKLGLHFNVFRK
jgi:hypothetical protein